MTRFAGFILLFVSLYGCAAQQVYNNHVYMENRCGQPLEMKVSNSSNMHSLDRNLTVAAGARALVASFASYGCLLYTSPSPRDRQKSRMPSSA